MENIAFKLHRNITLSVEHFFNKSGKYLWFYFKLIIVLLLTFSLFNVGYAYLGYTFFPDLQNIFPEIAKINYNNISNFKNSLDGFNVKINVSNNLLIYTGSYFFISALIIIPFWISICRFTIYQQENKNKNISIIKTLLIYSYFRRFIIILLVALLLCLVPLLNIGLSYPIVSNYIPLNFIQFSRYLGNFLLSIYITYTIMLFGYFCADNKQNIFKSFVICIYIAFRKYIKLTMMYFLIIAYITIVTYVFVLLCGLLFIAPMELFGDKIPEINIYSTNIKNLILAILCGISFIIYNIYILSTSTIFFARFYIYNREV